MQKPISIDKTKFRDKRKKYFSITIAQEPHGKGRPRMGRGKRLYTPQKTVAFENIIAGEVKNSIEKQKLGPPLLGPVSVVVTFGLKMPNAMSRRKKQQCRDLKLFPNKKPDIDNCEKAIFDAIQGLLFADDKQVVNSESYKVYSDESFIEIEVYEIIEG